MRVEQGSEVAAAPGSEHRIEDDRHVRIISQDFGNHCDVFDTAQQANLERRNAHIFQQGPRLIIDPFSVNRQHTFDTNRVLHGERRNHR